MEAFPLCGVIFRNQVSEQGLALREFLLLSGGESIQPPGQSDWGPEKGETGATEKHLLFKGRERAIAEKAFVLDANVQLRKQILKLSLTGFRSRRFEKVDFLSNETSRLRAGGE